MSDYHSRPVTARLANIGFTLILSSCALFSATANAQSFATDGHMAEQKGWQGLARVLDALTPSVDTSIKPTAAEIANRISQLLDQGRNDEALAAIEARKRDLSDMPSPGQDVQLLFLEARALSALSRHDEAMEIYRRMTIDYPELPEPWNNLAVEYYRRGQLELARDALQMALMANPKYATAQSNLGAVQLKLAQQAFERAAEARGDNPETMDKTPETNHPIATSR